MTTATPPRTPWPTYDFQGDTWPFPEDVAILSKPNIGDLSEYPGGDLPCEVCRRSPSIGVIADIRHPDGRSVCHECTVGWN